MFYLTMSIVSKGLIQFAKQKQLVACGDADNHD